MAHSVEKENGILILLQEFWTQCTEVVAPACVRGLVGLTARFLRKFSYQLDLLWVSGHTRVNMLSKVTRVASIRWMCRPALLSTPLWRHGIAEGTGRG